MEDITQVNNDFEQQIVDKGYKWFKDNLKKSLRGFQKKITDDKGTKYFITGYHWNFGKQISESGVEERDQYSFDVQFRIKKNNKDIVIDVRYSSDFIPNPWRDIVSLNEVEEFYEKTWNDMGADYYELNDIY